MIDLETGQNAAPTVSSVVIGSWGAPRTDTREIMEALAIAPAKVIALNATPPSRLGSLAGIRNRRGDASTSSEEQPPATTTVDDLVRDLQAGNIDAESVVESGHFAQQMSRVTAQYGADMSVVQEEPGETYSRRRMASAGAAIVAQTRRPVFLIPAAWSPASVSTVLMVLDGSKRHSQLIRECTTGIPLIASSATLVAGVSSTRCPLLGHLHLGKRDANVDDLRPAREKEALEEARRVADQLKATGAHAWFTTLANQDANTIAELVRSARISVVCLVIHESNLDSRRANSLLLARILEVLDLPVLLLPSVPDRAMSAGN